MFVKENLKLDLLLVVVCYLSLPTNQILLKAGNKNNIKSQYNLLIIGSQHLFFLLSSFLTLLFVFSADVRARYSDYLTLYASYTRL